MDTDGDGYSQLAPFFEAEAVVQACVKDVVSNNWADNSEYTFHKWQYTNMNPAIARRYHK
jgi:hypothetical protein